MNTVAQCDCCKEPIEGQAYRVTCCEHPVCEECARSLQVGTRLLNAHGMVYCYLGPCGDNGPEGKKKP